MKLTPPSQIKPQAAIRAEVERGRSGWFGSLGWVPDAIALRVELTADRWFRGQSQGLTGYA